MTDSFLPSSRYYGASNLTWVAPDGTEVPYLARRIIPSPQAYVPLERIRLRGDERIDNIAADSFGDPLLYWRIVDANGDADPADAAGPEGRLLVIPLPLEIANNGDT